MNASQQPGATPREVQPGVGNPPGRYGARRPAAWRRRTILVTPLAVFGSLVVAFGFSLGRNVTLVPSPLIGKPVPNFDLPPVLGRRLGLSDADLHGEVSLVNVFVSWCVACREEHPHLLRLARRGVVPAHGLNKDPPQNAARWLNEMGDPYTRTGVDRNGRVAIDWGIYGVFETHIIGADGRIAFEHIGAVTSQVLEEAIRPLVARLRREEAGS